MLVNRTVLLYFVQPRNEGWRGMSSLWSEEYSYFYAVYFELLCGSRRLLRDIHGWSTSVNSKYGERREHTVVFEKWRLGLEECIKIFYTTWNETDKGEHGLDGAWQYFLTLC